MGFSSGSVVNNPSAMQELHKRWVQPLGQEDPLEEGLATPSSILAWRPKDRGAQRSTVHSVAKSRTH